MTDLSMQMNIVTNVWFFDLCTCDGEERENVEFFDVTVNIDF